MKCDGKIGGSDEMVPNEDSQQRLFVGYDMDMFLHRSPTQLVARHAEATSLSLVCRRWRFFIIHETVMSYVNGASHVSFFPFLSFSFFFILTYICTIVYSPLSKVDEIHTPPMSCDFA
jgi:hypothetical protein